MERSLTLVLFCLIGCGEPDAGPTGSVPGVPSRGIPTAAEATTRTEMREVDFRVLEGSTIHVRRLVGVSIGLNPGEPIILDDETSYRIEVESAEVTIGYADLTRVLNEYTLAFDGAPVRDLRVSREEDEDERDEIELKGRLRRVLGLPFEIEGRPEPMPDGRIRIRTTSVQALDLQVGGLMHALGLEPADLLGDLEDRGLGLDGDDIVLDAGLALPPPRIQGRVRAVRVGDEGLALSLGPAGGPRPHGRANGLWFQGGIIRIGKMTQTDADLRITDLDTGDPLDFYPADMNRQLEAGYAKISAAGGLTLFVPDYGDMR